jgi:hypothetical protein
LAIRKVTRFLALLAVPTALLTATALGSGVREATRPVHPAAQGQDAQERPQVRLALRILRVEEGDKPADATVGSSEASGRPALTVLAEPVLTTLDGQTATVDIAGSDPSYSLSLSPTVEKRGEAGKNNVGDESAGATGSAAPGSPSLQVNWNVRLSGKTLPGGVTAVTLTGASRVVAGKESVIAAVALPDPQTGRVTRFQIQGTVTVGGVAPAGEPGGGPPPTAEGAAG